MNEFIYSKYNTSDDYIKYNSICSNSQDSMTIMKKKNIDDIFSSQLKIMKIVT